MEKRLHMKTIPRCVDLVMNQHLVRMMCVAISFISQLPIGLFLDFCKHSILYPSIGIIRFYLLLNSIVLLISNISTIKLIIRLMIHSKSLSTECYWLQTSHNFDNYATICEACIVCVVYQMFSTNTKSW